MKTLLKNAKILVIDKNISVINGSIVIENNRITHLGKAIPKFRFDKIINCKQNLLMPGFKNTHAHTPMTFLRGYATSGQLQEWLFETVFPAEDILIEQSEDIEILTKLGILEYLKSGITLAFDMYYAPKYIAKAAKELGFRSVILGTIQGERQSPEEVKADFDEFNNYDSLVSYKLGFHAEYTCGPDILVPLSKVVNELKTPVFTHLSETEHETNDCLKREGKRPPKHLIDLGLFNYGGGGFHCVTFNDEDMALFKKHQLSMITCPGSNSKLASGTPNLRKALDLGINVSLGTDGPASNDALDFFYEMRLLSVVQNLRAKTPNTLSHEEILRIATINGARTLNMNDLSDLSVGKIADIIMIDLHAPNMLPLNNIPYQIVYAASKDNILMTMIDGKILYYKNRFNVGENVNHIYKKAQQITDKIKKKLKKN